MLPINALPPVPLFSFGFLVVASAWPSLFSSLSSSSAISSDRLGQPDPDEGVRKFPKNLNYRWLMVAIALAGILFGAWWRTRKSSATLPIRLPPEALFHFATEDVDQVPSILTSYRFPLFRVGTLEWKPIPDPDAG
jgi:hypothetical protein